FMTSAYSHELQKYGINVGLTNWAAEFLQRLNLADKYEGVIEPDGTVGHIAALDDGDASRPFKAFLDVVLKRTSTGSK
ncbi:17339_t:CDS:2, partial [Gigaspora rosea]